MRRGRWITAGLTALALAGGSAGPAHAQTEYPVVGGLAFDGDGATLKFGTSTYVGGVFSGQLKATGSALVGTSPTGSGALAPAGLIPVVDGAVLASAEDGAGGVFIGGRFTKVGGVARRNLAHIRADGSVDPAFVPEPDGEVRTLDRVDARIAVAGAFGVIGNRAVSGGQYDVRLAVIDTATGAATAFTSPIAVSSLTGLDATGNRMYVGGSLTAAGASRGAVALDLSSGAILPWAPDAAALGDGPVDAIKAVGSVVVVGVVRNFVFSGHELIAVDPTSGAVKWRDTSPMSSPVLSKTATRLYVVPNYADINTVEPSVVPFALDPATGRRVWQAQAGFTGTSPYGSAAAGALLDGSTLYLTGGFSAAGGQDRYRTAAYDTTTGALKPWNPRLSAPGGSTLANLRGQIAIGGAFKGAGPTIGGALPNLARYRADGSRDPGFAPATFTAAVPGPGGPVLFIDALALDGNTLYVGGGFSQVNGQQRSGSLAAFDATTGKLLPAFSQNNLPSEFIGTIRVFPDRLLVHGYYSGSWEYTKAGVQITQAQTLEGRLGAVVAAFKTPAGGPITRTIVAPAAGTFTVESRLLGAYVVGSATATATAAGQTVTLTFDLNPLGRFIRSAYPDYRFDDTRGTFRFASGGPEVVAFG